MTEADWKIVLAARAAVLAKYTLRPPIGLPDSDQRAVGPASRDRMLLLEIYKDPSRGVDSLAAVTDMSSPMTRRVLAKLEAKDWIQLVTFSRRVRGFTRYTNITPDGLKAFGLEQPEGNGSFLHRRLQCFLRANLKKQGHDARLEFMLNGKSADIAYPVNEHWTAVEVGLSTADNEYSNLIKDNEAGFREVLLLVRETKMADQLRALIAVRKPKLACKFRLELLTDHLATHIQTD